MTSGTNVVNNQLNVQYYVRTYPGWNGNRIDTDVENCSGPSPAATSPTTSIWTSVTPAPRPVFAKTAMVHQINARWHKVFWLGKPPAIEIRYNVPY